jgi:hypothetical protein
VDSANRRHRSITGFLAALIIVVLAAAAILTCIPIMDCPECAWTREPMISAADMQYWLFVLKGCPRCAERGKITIAARWIHRMD